MGRNKASIQQSQGYLLFLPLLILLPSSIEGHGRLIEPPSRASMWRYGYETPPNYDDNQLFCGGVSVQYEVNGGKCGVCGDPWNGVREHEAGGKYAKGIIVRKYQVGQTINVTVELTANHRGFFEFRLCPGDSPYRTVTHDCLNRHLLEVEATGEVRFTVPEAGYSQSQKIHVPLRLPGALRCRACLLQWRYHAGNSWGTDPATGQGCVGCGDQEEFYGCADVAVGYDDVVLGRPAAVTDSGSNNRGNSGSSGSSSVGDSSSSSGSSSSSYNGNNNDYNNDNNNKGDSNNLDHNAISKSNNNNVDSQDDKKFNELSGLINGLRSGASGNFNRNPFVHGNIRLINMVNLLVFIRLIHLVLPIHVYFF